MEKKKNPKLDMDAPRERGGKEQREEERTKVEKKIEPKGYHNLHTIKLYVLFQGIQCIRNLNRITIENEEPEVSVNSYPA